MTFRLLPVFVFAFTVVRLASLCRPRGAHFGEPMTRANRTITLHVILPSRGEGMHLGPAPIDPFHTQGTVG